MLSGLLEGLGAAALLIVWYSIFVTRIASVIDPYVRGSLLAGYVGLFSFAAHPLTWAICYLGCEGAVRFLAAVVTGESCGTLPLVLLAWGIDQARDLPQGKVIPDEVVPSQGAYDLQVASCRSKDHWKYPLTICYREQFYQVVTGEVLSAGLRPYLYLLRRLPANETIKGLEAYDPDGACAE